MPGLIRGVARTAVVVGTANAVSHKQHQRWAAKDQQAAQAAAYQQQMYAPPPQYAAPPPQYAAPARTPPPAAVRPSAPRPSGGGGLHGGPDQPVGRPARARGPQ